MLQNPDGTPTNYTDPLLYLIEQIQPVTNQKLHSISQAIGEQTLPFGLRPFPFNVGGIEFYLTIQPNDHGLFALLGVVLADIQAFETLLCDLLATLDTKAGRRKPNANYDQLLSNNYSKTLGVVVRAFRHYLNDTETADALSYAKDRRNFLVHNILRKYGWWLMSDAEYRVCVYEIFEIRSAIKMAEDKLVKYLNDSNTLPIIRLDLDSLSKDINEDSIENHSI